MSNSVAPSFLFSTLCLSGSHYLFSLYWDTQGQTSPNWYYQDLRKTVELRVEGNGSEDVCSKSNNMTFSAITMVLIHTQNQGTKHSYILGTDFFCMNTVQLLKLILVL